MIMDVLLQVLTLVTALLLSLAVAVHADSAIFIALEAFSEYCTFVLTIYARLKTTFGIFAVLFKGELYLAAFYTPIVGPLVLVLPYLAVYPRKYIQLISLTLHRTYELSTVDHLRYILLSKPVHLKFYLVVHFQTCTP
jgi:hypothetical protein